MSGQKAKSADRKSNSPPSLVLTLQNVVFSTTPTLKTNKLKNTLAPSVLGFYPLWIRFQLENACVLSLPSHLLLHPTVLSVAEFTHKQFCPHSSHMILRSSQFRQEKPVHYNSADMTLSTRLLPVMCPLPPSLSCHSPGCSTTTPLCSM